MVEEFYEKQTQDFTRVQGDTINLAFEFYDKQGNPVNEIADQQWDSKFTLRDPITDEIITDMFHEEKSVTVDDTTDTFGVVDHGYDDGDTVQFSTDDTLPAGLSANTTYYIINSTTNTFKVSASYGGVAVDITDAGTGNQSVAMIVNLQKYHGDVILASKIFTANFTTDVFTSANHGYSDGDIVRVSTDDTLPAGLLANTDYYIITAATNTFQLSTSFGGVAIDITDAGTGNHSVALASSPAGKGIYYNNDTYTVIGLSITLNNQIVIVLTFKESVVLKPGVYPFDVEFSIDQAYKSKFTPIRSGNLIIKRENTKSVE